MADEDRAGPALRRISLTAVGLGLLLDQFATLILVDFLGSAVAVYRYGPENPDPSLASTDPSAIGLVILIGLGAACTVFGGYAAARIAGRLELQHAALVGVGDILIGAATARFLGAPMPLWYTTIAFLFVVPAALLGGHIARHGADERE